MNRMKRFLMTTATVIFAATAAATAAVAATTPESIVDDFKAQGYVAIEVKVGPTQIKAEAVKDGVKVEVVYDKATGQVLKSETEAAGTVSPGVEISYEDRDFVKGRDGDDSAEDKAEDADDDNPGHGGGSSGSGGNGGSGGNSGSGGGSGHGGSGSSGSGG
jgi:hypothetical protein